MTTDVKNEIKFIVASVVTEGILYLSFKCPFWMVTVFYLLYSIIQDLHDIKILLEKKE